MRYRVITDTTTDEIIEVDTVDLMEIGQIYRLLCESGVVIPWERVQRLVPVRDSA